ncbi:MAG: lipopolysaccharide biosynthesis protein [Sphingobium sp.]
MLIRQTLLYLPAQILAPLVQFASVLIWAHLLVPSDLGVVTLLVAIQEICYAAFFGWWGFYTLRFIAKYADPTERVSFLKAETTAVLGSALVQSLVILPVLWFSFGKAVGLDVIALAVVFMITRSLNNYSADRARAEARILLYSLIQVIGPVVGFLFGLFCIWYFGPSPDAVLAGFITAQLIGVALSFTMSDFGRRIGRSSTDIFKTAFSFGGTQTTSQMLAIVAMNAPRFIVTHQLGLAAVGMFSVGYGLGLRASAFAATLVTAGAYPMVVRKMQTEGRDAAFTQLRQNMILVALTVAPVTFGLLGVNRSVVELLVAAPYREVTLVVLPLATIGGLFRYLRAHTSDQVFLLNLQPRIGTLIAVCDFIVAVASAYFGIRAFGVVGAAFGPMMSGLVTFVASFTLSRFKFGFHAPLGTFARIIAAAAVMAAVMWCLPVARSIPVLLLHVALGAVIYMIGVGLALPNEARLAADKLLRRSNKVRAA